MFFCCFFCHAFFLLLLSFEIDFFVFVSTCPFSPLSTSVRCYQSISIHLLTIIIFSNLWLPLEFFIASGYCSPIVLIRVLSQTMAVEKEELEVRVAGLMASKRDLDSENIVLKERVRKLETKLTTLQQQIKAMQDRCT
jgi:hypothetical protein